MVIGIAGGSGAGKTTVARNISERLGQENVDYLSQDWYYKSLDNMTIEEREKQNMDHPNAFDHVLLKSHLKMLSNGVSIDVPVYDYSLHTRSDKTISMSPKKVAILEGILVLAIQELRPLLNLKIFVDAEPDIRLIRRLERDIRERGSTFDKTIQRYLTTVKPMHDAFVEPSKKYADIIVPRGGENKSAINMLVNFVEHHISGK